jgi:hypothetical protein
MSTERDHADPEQRHVRPDADGISEDVGNGRPAETPTPPETAEAKGISEDVGDEGGGEGAGEEGGA